MAFRFLSLHPQALNPPDIRTYRAFIEFVARGMKGRIEEKPTVVTVESFRVNFEAGMAFYRGYKMPKEVSTTLKEVRPPKGNPRGYDMLMTVL